MATDSSNNENNNRHQGVRAVATTTTDPRRSEKRAVAARGAAGALALSVLAVVLQSAATATPHWGYFNNPDDIKLMIMMLELHHSVGSGGGGGGGVGFVSMTGRRKRSLLKGAKDEIELDRRNKQKQGKLAAIALNFGVLVSAVYEGIYARRGGDPTKIRTIPDPRAATINNPGYREHHRPTNGGSISMTDASGKPYVGDAGNGSMASVATSGSATSAASPLRSSLKKPKPLGIHNPGFSAHSPTLSRNGSQKKVRIQTHSTEV
ncbi:hypothetical protein M0804_007496 [Polistes exclamans]|nr:hypothetical protein M0804_007496 [Polistes exclamans]